MSSEFFWRCWRCGGQHPTFEQKCPNGGPVYEGAPTRAAMVKRWEAFAIGYAARNPRKAAEALLEIER